MTRIFSAALLLSLLAAAAFADEDPETMRNTMRLKVRATMTQKLADAAGVDPATRGRMTQVIERFDDQIAKIQKDSREAYLDLKRVLESPQPDLAAVNRLSDRLSNNRVAVMRSEEERMREMRRTLTPVQYAKLIIAFPVINKQIRAGIRRAIADHAQELQDGVGE